MKRGSKQLRSTAYHEAAHAVAAFHFGITVKSLTVIPDEDKGYLGLCHYEFPRWFKPKAGEIEYGLVNDRTEILLQRLAVIDFAGNAAEKKLTGRYHNQGAAPDHSNAINRLSGLCGSPEESTSLLRWLALRAKALVDNPSRWIGIEAIAEALLERKTLTGDEASQIMWDATDISLPVRLSDTTPEAP